jgi:FkbM family methyltransferase
MIPSIAIRLFRPVLKRFGITLSKYPPQSTRDFIRLLHSHHIDLVLDVDANTGQFGQWLRDFGYRERILSFEPMRKEYEMLLKTSKPDKDWLVADKCGLGNVNGMQVFHISQNSVSSSFLPLTDYTNKVSPTTRYIAQEEVKIFRLEDYDYQNAIADSNSIFLILDVQGFEDRVLEGSKGILHKVKGLLVEMSLTQLYEGQLMVGDLFSLINSYGYAPHYFIPHVTTDDSGKLLQVDGVFFRDENAKPQNQ